MPGDFDLDQLFPPDAARFPMYSGAALVADVALYTVVPEPATATLGLIGLSLLIRRRRQCDRGFIVRRQEPSAQCGRVIGQIGVIG
jgi:uncharacterized protein (TIGR03382 family)